MIGHAESHDGASKATADHGGNFLNESSKPAANLRAVMDVLRRSPLVNEAFGRDEMLQAVMLKAPLPMSGSSKIGVLEMPRLLRDSDVSQLQEWLQGQRHLARVTRDITHQAVELRAAERSFHPVRTWLGSLSWDGDNRLDSWLSDYLGAEESAYSAGIGAMFLIAMVARIFAPGCKCDYMPIFESRQGGQKSSACAILAGPWFSDGLPDVRNSKDVSQHLPGKWLIEIAEMSAISKAEAGSLKAFVSRTTERYRPSYGRNEVVQPRQCVFVGTTNKSTYLRDETGARRFWPIKVGLTNISGLIADRDQIFAEAVARYNAGAKWWPDAAYEAAHIRPQQDARYDTDVWEETIASFIGRRSRVTIGEIAKESLFIETARVSTRDQHRITACLSRLNWVRGKKDSAGRIPWERALDL